MQRTHSSLLAPRPAPRFILAAAVTGALVLSGCSVNLGGSDTSSDDAPPAAADSESTATTSTTGQATGTASASPGVPTAPGYAAGEIPPIPLFTLPDLGLLSESTGAFTPDLTSTVTSVPGITVAPARCDEAGVLQAGTTVVDGSGGVATTAGGTSVVNDGRGAGVYNDGDVSIVNNGDGSGTYTSPSTQIVNNGDGSGTYTDAGLAVTISGTGSGTSTNTLTGESIVISGDGAGTYTTPTISIVNNGDGSGTYTDTATGLSIVNTGDGKALVGSETVSADPLPKVGSLGSFPPIDAVAPVTSCGTVITLEDGVLFDFGSADIRPDAQATLTDLAAVLNEAAAPAIHVYGHTDSVSDESFNQTLSEQRAQAVVAALEAAGTTATMDATGFGESRPVASNENPDGTDNPAGRQLNRRVEIFIPAF